MRGARWGRIIRHLKAIEAAAYPPELQQMQALGSWRDLAAYCQGVPRVHIWPEGYALWTRREIVDLAATAPVGVDLLVELVRRWRRTFGERPFSLDAREQTSWRLVRALERRGTVEVLEAAPWIWGGERFFAVRLRFRSRQ